jgi:hypothetical protein
MDSEELEFKRQLFENIKATGIMDDLKSNLRQKII